MNNKFILSLLCIYTVLCSCRAADDNFSYETKEAFEYIFSEKKGEYHIYGKYYLSNDTIQLPYSAKVIFESGSRIENGVIQGSNTIIQSKSQKPIFKRISFCGSFIGKPKTEWFSLVYSKTVDNSFELNSALNLAHISSVKELTLPYSKVLFVRADIDNPGFSDFLRQGTVEIKSNVCFDLNHSTIKCIPNSAKQYNVLFSRQSQGITICNGIICGDTKSHHGDDGEWGYGIELQGVHGFTLENLECKYCWGDGINIQVAFDGDGDINSCITRDGHCSDGIVRNVYCHHNRRQGMSVEGIINLEISNSTFNNTDGTRPKSGLDLEPYSKDNLVTGVTIKNCSFKENAYSGILIISKDSNVSDVRIENCLLSGNKDHDITMMGKDVKIVNCQSNKGPFTLMLVGDCDGVYIHNSILSNIFAQGFTEGHHVRNVVFTDCKVSYLKRKQNSAFGENLSLTDCDMTYNNCTFDFSKTHFTKGLFVFNMVSSNHYTYNDCFFYLGNNDLSTVYSQSFNQCCFSIPSKNNHDIQKEIDTGRASFNDCIINRK